MCYDKPSAIAIGVSLGCVQTVCAIGLGVSQYTGRKHSIVKWLAVKRAAGACPGQGFDYRRHAAVQLNEVSSLGLLNPGASIRVRVRVRIRGNSGACIEPTGCTRTTTHSKFTAHSLDHHSVVYTLAKSLQQHWHRAISDKQCQQHSVSVFNVVTTRTLTRGKRKRSTPQLARLL